MTAHFGFRRQYQTIACHGLQPDDLGLRDIQAYPHTIIGYSGLGWQPLMGACTTVYQVRDQPFSQYMKDMAVSRHETRHTATAPPWLSLLGT
jgi:hypothetical protein